MSAEQKLIMREAVIKLQNLQDLLPQNDDPLLGLLPHFGKHLATYLGGILLPSEFANKSLLAINDLRVGINQTNGEKIDELLCDHPKIIYNFIWDDLPSIVDVIFPEEFATEVKKSLNKMKK